MSLPNHNKGRFLAELTIVFPITNSLALRTSNILRCLIYCSMSLHKDLNQPTLGIMGEMENLFVDLCNGRYKMEIMNILKEIYKDDIDMNKLKIQLSLLQDILKTSNEGHKMGVKKVTMVKIVHEMFNVCKLSKTMLSEVNKVLKLYLILPLTSATAEQCFSSPLLPKIIFKIDNDSKAFKPVIVTLCT